MHVESTFLLDVKKWTNMIVGQLSPSIHVDSTDEMERIRSEDVSASLSFHVQQFTEEVEWGAYMGVPAIVGPELSSDENANYASLLLNLIARGFTGPVFFLFLYHIVLDSGRHGKSGGCRSSSCMATMESVPCVDRLFRGDPAGAASLCHPLDAMGGGTPGHVASSGVVFHLAGFSSTVSPFPPRIT